MKPVCAEEKKAPSNNSMPDIRIYTSEYLPYILLLRQLVGCSEYSS